MAVSYTYPDGSAILTVGSKNVATTAFDGWGYVHLVSNALASGKFAELDTFALPEAHDENFAVGFGDLTVHAPLLVLTSRTTLAGYVHSRSRAQS